MVTDCSKSTGIAAAPEIIRGFVFLGGDGMSKVKLQNNNRRVKIRLMIKDCKDRLEIKEWR
jgi:hypothetical protein